MDDKNIKSAAGEDTATVRPPGGRSRLYNWGGQVWRTLFPRKGDRFIDPRYVDEDEYPK